MGNRAVIAFESESLQQTLNEVGLYLHWNGGLESVEGFCKAADELEISEKARFIQMVANWFGGQLSVYVDQVRKLDHDNGDNGTYVLSKASGNWKVAKRYFHTAEDTYGASTSNRANHVEWVEELSKEVVEANKAIFNK